MSNNSDNDTINTAWGCLTLIVIYVICTNGGFWWLVGAVVWIFSVWTICIILDQNGVLSWVVGAFIGLFMALFIAYFIYINEWAWIIYAIGVIFLGLGISCLVQSYQLKQKAKRLDLISQEISKNWK